MNSYVPKEGKVPGFPPWQSPPATLHSFLRSRPAAQPIISCQVPRRSDQRPTPHPTARPGFL